MLKLFIGIIFLLLGWIYFYNPRLVGRINSVARDVLFNDRVILLARKKVSMVFFCLSFVAIFMGLSSMSEWAEQTGTQFLLSKERYRLYVAMQDYRAGNYSEAEAACKEVLALDPKNAIAIHQLAQIYIAINNARGHRGTRSEEQ